MTNNLNGQRTIQKTEDLDRIARDAVRQAQEESRRLGVPNVYSINGVLHYELPDGTLTTETPEIYQSPALKTDQ